MPKSQKARKAAFAELERRKRGAKPRMFKGMGVERLEEYAHEPLDRAKRGKK